MLCSLPALQQGAMESLSLLKESRIRMEPHHAVSKPCLKTAQKSLCPSEKAKGGFDCAAGEGGGAEESSEVQEGWGTLLKIGGGGTFIPKFRVNVLQVPLEAVAFQPLPQLHSALDAVGRKHQREAMEVIKVRTNAPQREAERYLAGSLHRQQTREQQQQL